MRYSDLLGSYWKNYNLMCSGSRMFLIYKILLPPIRYCTAHLYVVRATEVDAVQNITVIVSTFSDWLCSDS